MRYVIFGESHGPAIGVVLEGVPAGLELDLERVSERWPAGPRGKSPVHRPEGGGCAGDSLRPV